jgi:hypothetical protein
VPLEYSNCVADLLGYLRPGGGDGWLAGVLLKIVYLLVCRVLGFAVGVFRRDLATDAEPPALRRENAVLRRHARSMSLTASEPPLQSHGTEGRREDRSNRDWLSSGRSAGGSGIAVMSRIGCRMSAFMTPRGAAP